MRGLDAIHSEHASYLLSERGLDTDSYAYFISQERKLADRIIIPYIYQGNIVGYSARTIKKDIPHGYWECYYTNGQLFYTCYLINGMLYGMDKIYDIKGSLKQIEYYAR